MIFGFILISAIILIKYKPVYKVTIANETLGYIEKDEELENEIKEKIINKQEANLEYVEIKEKPCYEMQLVSRKINCNQEEIIQIIEEKYAVNTYKYYEVALNDESKGTVASIEEATEVIDKIKEEYNGNGLELNLQINEVYTKGESKADLETVEVAKVSVEQTVNEMQEEQRRNEEEKSILSKVNGINLKALPVTGRISSRFGVRSSLRRSTHTGLDIACTTGTDIKVAATGTVTFAKYNGAYGNLVKVSHGNGVETWYAHCSKIYAKVGEEVSSGDVIAAVGSTGNSTGPHLHFEIRINGTPVNPQNYLY